MIRAWLRSWVGCLCPTSWVDSLTVGSWSPLRYLGGCVPGLQVVGAPDFPFAPHTAFLLGDERIGLLPHSS